MSSIFNSVATPGLTESTRPLKVMSKTPTIWETRPKLRPDRTLSASCSADHGSSPIRASSIRATASPNRKRPNCSRAMWRQNFQVRICSTSA